MLFLHGGGPANSAERTWGRHVDAFGEHFHVLAPDELGFGRTGNPTDGDYSLPARVRHARAFLETLNLEDAVVIGHSQGGFIATCLAIQCRERVSRLVVLSSGTTAPLGNCTPDGRFSAGVQRAITFTAEPTLERLVRDTMQNTYFPERVEIDDIRPFYDDFVGSDSYDAYVKGTAEPLQRDPRSFTSLTEQFVTPFLPGFTTPTLILWGRDDDFAYLDRGFELYKLFPLAEMHIVPRCKHSIATDQPEVFREQVLAFLNRDRQGAVR